MTFQRWARLLIGVLRGDDFIASTVKADSKGEAARRRSRPAIWKLTIYRPCHLRTNTITRTVTVSLASKIQSSRSVTLQMKCIITTDTMPCLLTQCRGEVRWISLPPLVTFSSGWATPSNWFHPLTHTWVSHGYHQQTSAPPPLLRMSEAAKSQLWAPPHRAGSVKPGLSSEMQLCEKTAGCWVSSQGRQVPMLWVGARPELSRDETQHQPSFSRKSHFVAFY